MRVFRTYYTDREGKRKRAKRWYCGFTDHTQIRRRWPAFEDKRQSEALGRQLERLVNTKVSGETPDAQLIRWLESIPASLSKKLVSIGLLDPQRAAAGKPLSLHLADFERSLSAKGNTKRYVKTTVMRATGVVVGCKFAAWTDISASKVQHFLAGLRDSEDSISAQTSNFYLQAVKQFCAWMVQDRRATESPLAHLKRLNTRTDRRHDRRSLEPEEIRRLLDATAIAPMRFGMTGTERRLLYNNRCS